MPKHVIEYLVFRPASELPTVDLNGRDVLVLNPCDGYHVARVLSFEENSEAYQTGIYAWLMDEFLPHDSYVAWALLPDGIALREKFEDITHGIS